jgi:CRP-like cAMP-binding protein
MIGTVEVGNRELQHVERSVQERATLLSTTHRLLRFRDANRQELETLAEHTAVFFARQGSLVFQEATPARWMALVVRGQVDVLTLDASTRPQVVTTVGPGQFLREAALLDGRGSSATAVAATDTVLLVLTRAAFDRLLGERPTLVGKLLPDLVRLLDRRLRRTAAIA